MGEGERGERKRERRRESYLPCYKILVGGPEPITTDYMSYTFINPVLHRFEGENSFSIK